MLSPENLIFLPYTPDLTPAGTAYLCRSIALQQLCPVNMRLKDIHLLSAEIACKLAFQRHLESQGIAYDLRRSSPFTDPDNFAIHIGGRRCKIHVSTIFERDKIRQVIKNPGILLTAAALAPLEKINSTEYSPLDLLIFVFLTGLVTTNVIDFQRAVAAHQPVDLLHLLPVPWTRPARWKALGPVLIKSEHSQPVSLEVGGKGKDRIFLKEEIVLRPQERATLREEFYSVSYLRVKEIPQGRIGLHSGELGKTHIIAPTGWNNAWVYGKNIILAGFLTWREYQRSAGFLPRGSRTFQSKQTGEPSLSLSVQQLAPLQSLFSRAQEWQAGKTG
jgi:hypothetical protein